MFIASFKSRE